MGRFSEAFRHGTGPSNFPYDPLLKQSPVQQLRLGSDTAEFPPFPCATLVLPTTRQKLASTYLEAAITTTKSGTC
jgi:hypothetical protein